MTVPKPGLSTYWYIETASPRIIVLLWVVTSITAPTRPADTLKLIEEELKQLWPPPITIESVCLIDCCRVAATTLPLR